jgi:hypothetical protein
LKHVVELLDLGLGVLLIHGCIGGSGWILWAELNKGDEMTAFWIERTLAIIGVISLVGLAGLYACGLWISQDDIERRKDNIH